MSPSQRSSPTQAFSTLRNIIRHIELLSKQRLAPAYPQTDAKSVLQCGFHVKHIMQIILASPPILRRTKENADVLYAYISESNSKVGYHNDHPASIPLGRAEFNRNLVSAT